MDVTCVVQARTGSTRYPGKVLADLHGMPVLAFLLRRLRGWHVVVATSTLPADDEVAELAQREGVAVVRGPEEDVLGRFGGALSAHPCDVVVRITADCPLLDPHVIERCLARLSERGLDYVSNTLIRTFPDGLDVEAVRADALRTAVDEAVLPEEREHVTPFIYRHPERFQLGAVMLDRYLAHVRLTIDHRGDLGAIERYVARLPDPIRFGLEDLEAAGPFPDPPSDLMIRTALPSDADTADTPLDDPARRVLVLLDRGRRVGTAFVEIGAATGKGRYSLASDTTLPVWHAVRRELGLQTVELILEQNQ